MRSTLRFALIGLLLTALPQIVEARTRVLPAGTRLDVRTAHPIFAGNAWRGMTVSAFVDRPVVAPNGNIVVPRGSRATLEVVDVFRSSGRDRVVLRARSVYVGNRRYRVNTSPIEMRGPSGTRGTAGRIAGGTGIGAVAGGLVGGGTGAAVGAAAGATTGAAVAGSRRSRHVTVPAESRLQFRLASPARI
jgi:hypothetical protein